MAAPAPKRPHQLVVPKGALLPRPTPELFELMAEVGYNSLLEGYLPPERASRPEHAWKNQGPELRAEWENAAREMYGMLARHAGVYPAAAGEPPP